MPVLPHRLLIGLVFAGLIGCYAALAVWHPIGYIWATYEDLYGEWSQTFLFAIAGALFARAAWLRTRYRWSTLILSAACLYVFFEEISWGQRIFGFRSPEFFSQYNLQGETNVHNFFTGPYSTLLKDSIRYVVALGLIGYGLIFPLLLRARQPLALFADRLGLFAPPLSLGPFFVLAAVLELQPFAFNEAEIAELAIGFALAATAAYQLLVAGSGVALAASTPPARIDANQSRKFAARLSMIIGLTGVLAFATTSAFYHSPSHRARIDRRIENGIEKFAARYRRFEQWDTAIVLYEHLLENDPDNSFLLRSIARCYQGQGDTAEFELFANRAVDVELARYAVEPWRASVLRSLVRSYVLLGDQLTADRYLAEALALGLERVADHPASANAAFSLGRTYDLAGDAAKAREQYARAYTLRPGSGRFRRAYLAAEAEDE